jgi:hypothetical protein
MRWSLGFGPFRIYGGKSSGARRAEALRKARERARRAEARAWQHSPEGRAYHESAVAELAEMDRRRALASTGPVRITRVIPYDNFPNANVYVTGNPATLPENPLTTVSMSIPGWEHVRPGNVVSFDLESTRPTAAHLIEQGENLSYRGTVGACRIDPLDGGEFDVIAEGRPTLHTVVPADMAHRFAGLRNRDVVHVILSPDGRGVEAFWHVARASGAQPRNPADFPQGWR